MTAIAPTKRTWAQMCEDRQIWAEHEHAGELILKVDTSKELFDFARRWAMRAERQKAFPPEWRLPQLTEPWAAIAVSIARTAANHIGCYQHDLESDLKWDVTAETKRLRREAEVAQQMLDILNGIDLWDWEESSIFPDCENRRDNKQLLKWADSIQERSEALIAGRLPHQMDIAAARRVCARIIQRADKAEAGLPERLKAQKAAATPECRADYRLTEGALTLWTRELFQPQPKRLRKKLVALLAELRDLAGAKKLGDDRLEQILRHHLRDGAWRAHLVVRVLRPLL
jgi:hypothetical protein